MIEISVVFSRQVKTVQFILVSSSYSRAVLASIGGQLLKLHYRSCKNIDLSQLVPCDRLKELEFNCYTSFNETIDTPIIQPFLPKLKNLKSTDTCLGALSPVFECARVALKHLNLSCCHLGVPGVTQLSWRDIPDLWPNLETIDLSCATDLTMDNLRLFVFRMENLKWIGVHLIDWEDEEEVKSFDDLKKELQEKKSISLYENVAEFSGCCYHH